MLLRAPLFPSRHEGLHTATVAVGPDNLLAFPLLPTISATTIPPDCDKEIVLHQQETQGLLVELYLNLQAYVFQLKTDLETNKKLP